MIVSLIGRHIRHMIIIAHRDILIISSPVERCVVGCLAALLVGSPGGENETNKEKWSPINLTLMTCGRIQFNQHRYQITLPFFYSSTTSAYKLYLRSLSCWTKVFEFRNSLIWFGFLEGFLGGFYFCLLRSLRALSSHSKVTKSKPSKLVLNPFLQSFVWIMFFLPPFDFLFFQKIKTALSVRTFGRPQTMLTLYIH